MCGPLTGEKQHFFLPRQHNSNVGNREVPGTSVLRASPCATGLGYYCYSTAGSSIVHPKDALAVLLPGPLKLPREWSCKHSKSEQLCFFAGSITPPQAAYSSAPKCFEQAPWEGVGDLPATPANKLLPCLESGCPHAMRMCCPTLTALCPT